jgi:hypothetical protein
MRKRICAFVIAAAVLGVTAAAAGIAGQKDDPLVSQSYLNNTYTSSLIQKAQTQTKSALDAAWTSRQAKLDQMEKQIPSGTEELAKQVAQQMSAGPAMKTMTISAGSVVTMSTGCQFSLTSGAASFTAGKAIDLTTGTEVSKTVTVKHLYLIPENTTAKLQIQTGGTISLGGSYTLSQENVRQEAYTKYAEGLHELGLFQGTSTGYALDRKSTRIEGLVMLVRLMGEEENAKAYQGIHPFRDVPKWADRYVAYAYGKGYTRGSSATTFGPSDLMTGNQYLTFLLRALGYDDTAGDFVWSSAVKTAADKGILSTADANEILRSRYFYRDHVVYTSYKALIAKKKGGAVTLATDLARKGVFTQSDWNRAQKIILG